MIEQYFEEWKLYSEYKLYEKHIKRFITIEYYKGSRLGDNIIHWKYAHFLYKNDNIENIKNEILKCCNEIINHCNVSKKFDGEEFCKDLIEKISEDRDGFCNN